MRTSLKTKCRLSHWLALFFVSLPIHAIADDSIDNIIDEIRLLENQRDPKCYATASRLEDFMFGTALSHQARFSKNLLQKDWVLQLWRQASKTAIENSIALISETEILKELNKRFTSSRDKNGHWELSYPNRNMIKINQRDKRQYSNIAYSLRALLAVQQQSLLDLDLSLLPLEAKAMKAITNHLDLLSLSVLKLADTSARKDNSNEINQRLLTKTWKALSQSDKPTRIDKKTNKVQVSQVSDIRTKLDLSVTNKIIAQKIASYKAYNDLSNQLFYRNLQVYFARVNLPKSDKNQKAFRNIFTESMIQFSFDLYKESEKIALKNGHANILESDVFELLQLFVPHTVDEFEDSHFFPKLPKPEQVTIESYDADSFRDNSAHWRFLKLALNSQNLKAQLQADPFALELIAENIALFGVLSLRMAGIQAKRANHKYLAVAHYRLGLKEIAKKIKKNRQIDNVQSPSKNTIASSSEEKFPLEHDASFTDISNKVGLNFSHRTSNWLNRLLRSFLEQKKGTGVVFVPPAFGGAGVAAEDINNDGWIDLLILSGAGNKLYMNQNGESFVDVSEQSGINWRRNQDNQPGEPRQPLIADLNNDGLQDIVITYVGDTHRVYKNMGDFKFVDVTNISQLGGIGLVGGPATIADFNNDGLLDIYVSYFGNYTKGVLPTLKRVNNNGTPNKLFENIGGFKFKDVTGSSGVDNTGWTQAVSDTDLNGDHLQDIIVGNDFGSNAYYTNNGDGTFTDRSRKFRTDKASYSMSIGIADLNQDLVPDIYVSNIVVMNKDEKYISPSETTEMKFNSNNLSTMRVLEANDLFLSTTKGGQLESYRHSNLVDRGYSSTGWSWDADFFDSDNDGDMDLYVLNGMNEFNLYTSDNPYFTDASNTKQNVYIPVAERESNIFFKNQDGRLVNSSKGSGLDLLGNSRSASYLDFDQDGDLDIVLNNFHEKAVFYRNNIKHGNNGWIKIKLQGDPTKRVNRDAIGARIVIHTKSGQTLWREINSSTGYMSVHPKIQHFGLGQYQIEHVEITWPNGERQSVKSLDLNRSYLVSQSGEIREIRAR